MIPERSHQSQQDLATNGRAGSYLYLPAWILIQNTTPIYADWPRLSWLLTLLLLVTGVLRLSLGIRLSHWEDRRRWLALYSSSVVTMAFGWGLMCGLSIWYYQVSWAAYLVTFATAGFVAGGTVTLSTHLGLQRGFIILMVIPGLLACLALGGRETLGLSVLFALYLVFMLSLGGNLHRQYWAALDNSHLLAERAIQLEKARRQAELAVEAKGRFLANMSHEIRTPINGILGFMELLRSADNPQQRREYLDVMQTSAATLVTVIDDVLDLSKIEAGKLQLENVPFDFVATVREAVKLMTVRATERKISLRLVTPEQALGVSGDPNRVRQVLLNLISNAIKFTERGEVNVQVAPGNQDDNPIRIEVHVRDSGIGISEQQRHHIFDAFVQADDSTTRRYGGTGLGLAISAQLVERMGGHMAVQSELGQGSDFSFVLTLERATLRPSQPEGSLGEPALPRSLRVLVVEDNPVNQLLAEEMLKRLGCQSSLSENGQQAVAAVQRQPFDVILMDCEMPVMDGFDATRAIRQWEQEGGSAPMPIVALTANAMQEDKDRALESGMNDFLSKPFTLAGLREKLDLASRHG